MIRLFRHHISRAFVLLALCDLVLIALSAYLGQALFELAHGGTETFGAIGSAAFLVNAVIYAIVMVASMLMMGLYDRGIRDAIDLVALRVVVSFVLGAVALVLLFMVAPTRTLGSGPLVVATLIAYFLSIGSRHVFTAFVDQRLFKKRELVIGAGHKAKLLSQLRRRVDTRYFELVGYVPIEGQPIEVEPDRVVVLDVPLHIYVRNHDIDEILVAVDDRRASFPVEEILECKMNGVNVVDLLTFFERQTGKVRNDILQPAWMIYSDGFSQGVLRDLGKRLFDIVVSLAVLTITSPIMLLTALAIWVESGFKGPVIYRQVRIGQGGNPFKLLKFRSMFHDAEHDGVARWAMHNDDRITRVGRLIRNTRIDELPQLINVLRGEMSFVGPRPERPEFVVELNRNIPFYAQRHRVKPGITGWAQIRYPYGASEKDAGEKLQYDLYYLKNRSIFLDLMIILQTAQVVFWGKGAR